MRTFFYIETLSEYVCLVFSFYFVLIVNKLLSPQHIKVLWCTYYKSIIFFRIFAWRFSFDCTSNGRRSHFQRYLPTNRKLARSGPRGSSLWWAHLDSRLPCPSWHITLLSKTLMILYESLNKFKSEKTLRLVSNK